MEGLSHVVVVGAGVVGLSSALVALQRGYRVTLVAEAFTPDTVSTGAGALWRPVFIEETPVLLSDRWASTTFHHLADLNEQCGPDAVGVAWTSGIELYGEVVPPMPSWASVVRDFRVLNADDAAIEEISSRTGRAYGAGFSFTTLMVDPPRYLDWLLQRVEARGGRVVRRHISDLAGLANEPGVDAVLNCTGIGAALLVESDHTIRAVQGQTLKVRAPSQRDFVVDLSLEPEALHYVLPRLDAKGTVVLGGTHDELPIDTPTAAYSRVDPAVLSNIRAECGRLCPAVAIAPRGADEAWAGVRPVRCVVRVEHDPDHPKVVHNYGHGGSGITLHWGTAEDAVAMVEAILGPGRLTSSL